MLKKELTYWIYVKTSRNVFNSMEINGLGYMGIAYHSLGGFGEAIKYQEATVAFGHVILDQNIITNGSVKFFGEI